MGSTVTERALQATLGAGMLGVAATGAFMLMAAHDTSADASTTTSSQVSTSSGSTSSGSTTDQGSSSSSGGLQQGSTSAPSDTSSNAS